MIFRTALVCLALLTLMGCEKTLSIDGPPYQRKAVLTGLLFPDSTLSIQLTYTAPANTTAAYETITDARVQFFDDGQLLGTSTHRGQGFYRLAVLPQPGHTYRVVADVPGGYGQLSAEDQMPARPSGQLVVDKQATGNPNNNPDFKLTLQPRDATTPYWFSFYVTKEETVFSDDCATLPGQPQTRPCTGSYLLRSQRNYILTDSGYLDRFNAVYDALTGTYIFSAFTRYDPAAVLGKPVELTFTTYNQLAYPDNRGNDDVNTVDLLAVGPNYDRFLRSVLTAQMNQITDSNNLLNNPFAEVTPIYTNVKGGLGVFGAVSVQRFLY